MVGRSDSRTVGRWSRSWAILGGAVFLSVGPTVRPSVAQVGHPPNRSPYRDITLGGSFVPAVGYLSGDRGVVGVGPSNGKVFGVRYERPLSRVLGASLSVADALTSRYVVDPTKDSASRTSGPVDNSVVLLDVGLHMVLTGGKTWHGFAPYLGVSAGVAVASAVPSDTSQYRFRTRFTFGPQLGLRWYLWERLSLRADARVLFWRLTYPLQFRDPSPVDGSRALPETGALTEWTRHPWLSAGVGWTF